MIVRKRRLLRAVILWLIETGLSLLRNSVARKSPPTEQNEATAKLTVLPPIASRPGKGRSNGIVFEFRK